MSRHRHPAPPTQSRPYQGAPRRPLLLGVVMTVGAVGVAVLLTRPLLDDAGELTARVTVRPDEALALVTLGAAAVLAWWLGFLLALGTLRLAPGQLGIWGGRAGDRLAPVLSRRARGVLLMLTVAGGPTGMTAAAAPAPGGAEAMATSSEADRPPDPRFAPGRHPGLADAPSTHRSRVDDRAPEPGWQPTRPRVARADQISLLSSCPDAGRALEVVVRSGDTLWGIASRHLGPDATPAQVAEHWPRWYAANRSVIGDDPDLILPGQVLAPPARTGSGHSEGGRP